MTQPNETFPTGLEAAFLIIGLFVVEYLIGAALYDLRSFLGLDPRNIDGVVTVLGNGVIFTAVLHHKRLSYRSLFHHSNTSVAATVGILALPILFIVPALTLVMLTVDNILEALFPLSQSEQAMFENMMSNGLASWIGVCILAPVLEEMLFRGIILRSFLHQYSRATAIIGSATLFGLAHLNLYQFAVGLILGSILGWLYERSRSIWPCILLHSAYNSGVSLIFFSQGPQESQDWQPSLVVWIASFSLAFFGTFLLQRLLSPSRPSA